MAGLFPTELLFWCVVASSGSGRTATQHPPHIIIIVADDLGWNDVGFHGSYQIPTPNIDALATSGVILDRYYVQPICTPSRAALMTGKYPIHTGMQHGVILAAEPYGVSLNETFLPQHLNQLGYLSHVIGKWHLGSYKRAYTPTERGFVSHFGYWTGKKDYYDHTNEDRPGSWGYDLRRDMDVARDELGQYTTELLTRQAERLISDHPADQPLLLYLAHLAVHSANRYQPLQAPSSVVQRFQHIHNMDRRTFAGMLAELDDSVGRVTAALHQRRMLNNSIIVFTTDNGGPAATFDYNAASNWPLRGVKNTLWEGGVRGAGFVWSPLLEKRSYIYKDLLHVTDLLPTLLSAAGGDAGSLGAIDGRDVWKQLSQNLPSGRQQILLNIDPVDGYEALIEGNFKYINGSHYNDAWSGWYGPSGRNNTAQYDLYRLLVDSPAGQVLSELGMLVSKDQWTSLRQELDVVCQPRPDPVSGCQGRACLFDLTSDPCEYNDLADQMPQVTERLSRAVNKYRAGMVPPRNKPMDPHANPKYWDYAWVNWGDLVDPPLP